MIAQTTMIFGVRPRINSSPATAPTPTPTTTTLVNLKLIYSRISRKGIFLDFFSSSQLWRDTLKAKCFLIFYRVQSVSNPGYGTSWHEHDIDTAKQAISMERSELPEEIPINPSRYLPHLDYFFSLSLSLTHRREFSFLLLFLESGFSNSLNVCLKCRQRARE